MNPNATEFKLNTDAPPYKSSGPPKFSELLAKQVQVTPPSRDIVVNAVPRVIDQSCNQTVPHQSPVVNLSTERTPLSSSTAKVASSATPPQLHKRTNAFSSPTVTVSTASQQIVNEAKASPSVAVTRKPVVNLKFSEILAKQEPSVRDVNSIITESVAKPDTNHNHVLEQHTSVVQSSIERTSRSTSRSNVEVNVSSATSTSEYICTPIAYSSSYVPKSISLTPGLSENNVYEYILSITQSENAAEAFRLQSIDGEALVELKYLANKREETFLKLVKEEIGITSFGIRLRILGALKKLA
jgi:hypothetical protein